MIEFDVILDNDIAARTGNLSPRLLSTQIQEEALILSPEDKLYPEIVREQAAAISDEYPTVYYWPDETMVVHWRPSDSMEYSNVLDAYDVGRDEREDLAREMVDANVVT